MKKLHTQKSQMIADILISVWNFKFELVLLKVNILEKKIISTKNVQTIKVYHPDEIIASHVTEHCRLRRGWGI